jgi:putative transposase
MGPSQRREMAETAVERRGVSIALACRAFGVSETCYRYSPKLKDENEEIADLLTGLTDARKTWGFGLCFLHLRNVKGRAIETPLVQVQWRGLGTTSGFTGSTASWR